MLGLVQNSIRTILALNQLDLTEPVNAKINNPKLVTTFILNNRAPIETFARPNHVDNITFLSNIHILFRRKP
jgi:hypothetical protein